MQLLSLKGQLLSSERPGLLQKLSMMSVDCQWHICIKVADNCAAVCQCDGASLASLTMCAGQHAMQLSPVAAVGLQQVLQQVLAACGGTPSSRAAACCHCGASSYR